MNSMEPLPEQVTGAELVQLADTDPFWAIAVAQAVTTHGHLQTYRALGLAYRAVGDPEESRRWLELGIEEAERRKATAERAELWITYSATMAMLGDFDGALALLDDAEQTGDAAGKQHAQVQRAGMLARRGHIAEALEIYECVQPELEDRGDNLWLTRLHNNRGLLRTFTGDLSGAERDLRTGLGLSEDLDLTLSSAEMRHNLGFVLTHRGDLLDALEYYSEAGAVFEALKVPNLELALDRCETLMYAGLTDDALAVGAAAVERLARRGMVEETAEGLLKYARSADAANAPGAVAAAERANDALAAIGNQPLADAATVIALRSRSRALHGRKELLAEIMTVADQLEEKDQRLAAGSAGLLASRVALGLGEAETAATSLDRAERRLGINDHGMASVPMSLAVELALTSGLLAEVRGDTAQASRLARQGLATVESIASQIGFSGQQAYARGCALDLIRLQVRLALRSKGNARLFRWVEAGRTRFDQPPRLRRPDDEAVALELEQLRWIHTERLDDPADAELAAVQARAERRVRSTVRRAAEAGGGATPVITIGDLKTALKPTDAFVSWFSPDESMWELMATDRGSRRRRIAPEPMIRDLADQLSLAMGGLAIGRTDATESAASAGLALQAVLVPDDPAQQLIINPPPDLFSIPWSALPGLTDRSVTVTPSAAAYLRPRRSLQTSKRALVVAGPALERSAAEAGLVTAHYADAELLSPSAATTRRVLDGLAEADIAHFACHAVFRPDNAAFSYLELSDGPLFLYDLERLRSGPQTVVLSACSAARSGSAGNQLHGFVTALLRAGARTVIAPIAAVPDTDETLDLVDRLHGELQVGTPPATALSRAKVYDDPLSSYTSHAFQCFGWG